MRAKTANEIMSNTLFGFRLVAPDSKANSFASAVPFDVSLVSISIAREIAYFSSLGSFR